MLIDNNNLKWSLFMGNKEIDYKVETKSTPTQLKNREKIAKLFQNINNPNFPRMSKDDVYNIIHTIKKGA